MALRGWGSGHTDIMYASVWAQTVQGSYGVGRLSPGVRRCIASCTYIVGDKCPMCTLREAIGGVAVYTPRWYY